MKKKILIIDDEESFTMLVKANLEATGRYDVWTENRAKDAVSAARIYKPDLILLDIIMPQKGGLIIATEISDDKRLQNIPIIFLTALITKEDEKKIDGKYPFIAKPIKTEELIALIEANTPKSGA